MSQIPKMRTPEQKSRKMLNEEMTLMGLEMAIKKEQFRIAKNPQPQFREIPVEKEITPVDSSENQDNEKGNNMLNSFLNKIGF
ncbi:hypothetical protein C5F47_05360 [Nitrosopumilus cobalaminigenes]|uniref:Uncharacterized protein n=1 Tax=Nitrosopumilus cobalaminigenes TaxID=1470066 RepID=A0A7D5M0Y0_9ARCH|nr:hypothetical protein [Nitrosopumilus cobalaminigenes]QLH03015.1 hypothetical protein C5F47_05360 [Nitrosopumilus cobalaminigenes]